MTKRIKSYDMTGLTAELGATCQAMYDFFNRELFGGELKGELIVSISYHTKALGYFKPDAYKHGERVIHELVLNPSYFNRPQEAIHGTLVHEMCHEQRHYVKPYTTGYHCRLWATMMKNVGLYPSDTGQPGGKEIGNKVSHYVIEGGPFQSASRALLATGIELKLKGRERTDRDDKKRASKSTFYCRRCGQKAYGKPDSTLICGDCKLGMWGPHGQSAENHDQQPAKEPESYTKMAKAYSTLYLIEGAPLPVVKAAYKQLAKIHHSDVTQGDDERMKIINASYDIITKNGSGK